MAGGGTCPQCGGGTRRSHAPASDNVGELHEKAKARRERADLYERFERYYADREAERGPDAWRTPAPDLRAA